MGKCIVRSSEPKVLTHNNGEITFVTMNVGANTYAIDYAYWLPKPSNHVIVGKYCSLARQLVFNIGRNHNFKIVTTYPLSSINKSKKLPPPKCKAKNPHQIIIGNDVWIGHGVTIMGGVKIGNGAVIGAGSVVAKNIPPYAIAVGNPVRVIKYRFDEETIRKFLAVKWWNWDLEKIADNLPLMNDVEKFLQTHYSPELENFPEDDFSRQIDSFIGGDAYQFLRAFDIKNSLPPEIVKDFLQASRQLDGLGGGCRVYQFITDFKAMNPLWPKVVKKFKQANSENALLVIWLDKDATEENSRSLTESIGDSKNILIFKHDKIFSPAALRKATHFITTREMSTLEALDYLWDTDVKIISSLDDGIFDGEPPVDWKLFLQ